MLRARDTIPVFCCSFFGWAVPAMAGGTPVAGVLTLADALSRAEAVSPIVRRARAERETVAAREVGASQVFPSNPIVSAAIGPRREAGRQGIEYMLHAEQTIEIGGQRGARRAVVSRALRTAGLREDIARAETRARVRAVYVGAQLARARVAAATQREALVGKVLEAVRARVEGGASSNVDSRARPARARQRGARPGGRFARGGGRPRPAPPAGRPAPGAAPRARYRGGRARPARRESRGADRARGEPSRGAGGGGLEPRGDRRRYHPAAPGIDTQPGAVRGRGDEISPGRSSSAAAWLCRCRYGAATRGRSRSRAPRGPGSTRS